MFGTDDDKQSQSQPPSQPAAPASTPPPVNPITGVEPMGQPSANAGLPKIVTGANPDSATRSPAIKPKPTLLTALPQMAPAATPASSPAMPSPLPSPLPSALPSSPDMPEPAGQDENEEANTNDNPELSDVKKKALKDLTPLIDKLDLPPEEKFKTLMMVVQASDNSDLVEKAYEAASQIGDDKAKAQALLDVINEVNYFTKPHSPLSDDAE